MEALRLFPSTSIAGLRHFVPWQRPERSRLFVDYLVIAGGGSGRILNAGSNQSGAGGGAGGYKTSMRGELNGGGFPATPPLILYKGIEYTITVGAGGAAGTLGQVANSGTQSRIAQRLVLGADIITTQGGQGVASTNTTAAINNGGGASQTQQSPGGDASASLDDQYRGGSGFTTATLANIAAGGGGGAGAVGGAASAGVGGNGGAGRASSITGTSVTRAGGGGGSHNAAGSQGTGGTGGGGAAAFGVSATAGTVNTGGGGGGTTATITTYTSGAGGSGIIILRYPTMYPPATTTGSPTITTVSGYRIYEFTGSGSISF